VDDQVRLLLAWNASINLTAIRDPVEIAIRHVADSLVAMPILRDRGVDRFVDLGSGGGYPGLPLAAALPANRAVLVESIAKKVRFLDTAIAAIGLVDSVRAIPIRAEILARDAGQRGRWPAVTARAVASLPELVELGLPFLRPGGVLLAWKSGDPDDPDALGGELRAAERALAEVGDGRISIGEPVSAIAAAGSGGTAADRTALAAIDDHRLVLVERGRRPIASSWPRDPAARRRRPW
jgi:16S rRNA (guanine527-N7)-methyltransferase